MLGCVRVHRRHARLTNHERRLTVGDTPSDLRQRRFDCRRTRRSGGGGRAGRRLAARTGLADASTESGTDIGRSAGTDTGDDIPSWGQFLPRVVTESGYLGADAAGQRSNQVVMKVKQFRDWADGGARALAGLLTWVRDR